MEVRIYYEDTDCGGVVYYANYLKYFERARTHFLEEHGLSVSGLIQQGTEFRVTKAEVAYRSAAVHGEILVMDTTAAADRRIERVLWNDPASGVMRHADAGYELAIECAQENDLNLPMIESGRK